MNVSLQLILWFKLLFLIYCFDADPMSILRFPCISTFRPDEILQAKIARYVNILIGKPVRQIANRLPVMMPFWGAVHIKEGGDVIRAGTRLR